MKLKHYSIDKLKKEILTIVTKYIDPESYKIFFFGSRVNGTNFERSDIDIGIEGKDRIPPKIKLQIEDELENIPTLYKFDFVDFTSISADFKKEAKKNIEYIL